MASHPSLPSESRGNRTSSARSGNRSLRTTCVVATHPGYRARVRADRRSARPKRSGTPHETRCAAACSTAGSDRILNLYEAAPPRGNRGSEHELCQRREGEIGAIHRRPGRLPTRPIAPRQGGEGPDLHPPGGEKLAIVRKKQMAADISSAGAAGAPGHGTPLVLMPAWAARSKRRPRDRSDRQRRTIAISQELSRGCDLAPRDTSPFTKTRHQSGIARDLLRQNRPAADSGRLARAPHLERWRD